ncbi:MAG: hypothetical protein M3144_00870 [Actinomycetota bacterium]|nr:hypothetical protein [Actinomycetota bacterium]
MRLDRIDAVQAIAVEEAMDPGPATIHADADVAMTVERLQASGVPDIVVTTPRTN